MVEMILSFALPLPLLLGRLVTRRVCGVFRVNPGGPERRGPEWTTKWLLFIQEKSPRRSS